MATIGVTFSAELIAAGLNGLPFSWAPDTGEIFHRDQLTEAQNAALDVVLAAHDPSKQPVARYAPLAIVQALRVLNPEAARAFLTQADELDKAEFFAAVTVRADEPRVLAMLGALGVTADQLANQIASTS